MCKTNNCPTEWVRSGSPQKHSTWQAILARLKLARCSVYLSIVSSVLLLSSSGFAESYPASYWTTKSMRVPVGSCVAAANKAIHAAGLVDITKSETATGGHTATTRGYIVCIRLPKAGDCQGDGATAVIVTAGNDAKVLKDKIHDSLKVPVLIDCGSQGNPVDK